MNIFINYARPDRLTMMLLRRTLLVTLITSTYGLIKIESYIDVCNRNSPEVNECLVQAVQKGLEPLAGGIKDLGVPGVDPYHQKELRMEYKNNQILAKVVVKDIYVTGLKHSNVRDARLRADEDKFHLEIDMFSPQIQVKGKYNGGGSYNSLQVNASGDFHTTMTDLTYTWKLDGTPEKINNETYIRINSFYMRPDVGDMKSVLTNDNPDSRDLTSLGNRITNENWRTLYRELLPFVQSNWNKSGIRVANKIFLKVPYKQLFPL